MDGDIFRLIIPVRETNRRLASFRQGARPRSPGRRKAPRTVKSLSLMSIVKHTKIRRCLRTSTYRKSWICCSSLCNPLKTPKRVMKPCAFARVSWHLSRTKFYNPPKHTYAGLNLCFFLILCAVQYLFWAFDCASVYFGRFGAFFGCTPKPKSFGRPPACVSRLFLSLKPIEIMKSGMLNLFICRSSYSMRLL